MSISDSQQDGLSAIRATKSKQDLAMPFLINRKDGRLMPNTELMRKHADYRPYTGSVKASLSERMLFLSSGATRPRMINSTPEDEPEPFDIGKATKGELVDFAFNEFGAALDETADIRTLRKQLASLASPRVDTLS